MTKNIAMPIIISLTLIILMSLIGIYAVKVDFRSCEKFEFSIFNNKIVCGGYRGVEVDGQGNILNHGNYVTDEIKISDAYLMPFLILSLIISSISFYFYFFRFSHFAMISNSIGNVYDFYCGKDIKKESYFLGTFFFIYLFILLGIWFLIGFMFSVNYEKLKSIWTYIQILIYSLSISVPITISIYFSKKWLNSSTPKKAFFKSPLSTIIPSLLFVIIIELYFYVSLNINRISGESRLILIFWPINSWIYMLGIILTSLLLTSYLYTYCQQKNIAVLRLVMVFLLCMPYLLTFIGIMS